MPPPILILTGAPGAGKTTVARLLAEGSGRAVHLESDLFFGFIRAGRIEPWRPESHRQNTVVMDAVARAATAYAEAGYLTVLDGILSPAWFLDPLRDALTGAGNGVAYAVLRAPLATCVSRVSAREGAPGLDPSVIEQLWGDFADLGPLEGHVVESSGRDARGVADEVASAFGSGRLTL